jgi:uncharacterized protein
MTRLLDFYKYWISPLLGCNCRFHPSCSAYTREALQKHGLFKGLFLGARRILSCHPYSRRPFKDPVP